MRSILNERQAAGRACVWCGLDFDHPARRDRVVKVPAGRSTTGTRVFACSVRCADKYSTFMAKRATACAGCAECAPPDQPGRGVSR
ncbi:hypothetical protein [Actinophytocola sediminis]